MNKEIFKDIPNYEGTYQVSNLGNVKSLGNEKTRKEKILKPRNNGNGYYTIRLCKESKCKNITVHALVAMAFLNHVPDGHKIEVDHKNDITTDNRLENLQLLTGADHRMKTSKNRNPSRQYTGVCWHKVTKKWMAQIQIEGKNKYLGLYETEIEAHLAYQKVLEMYNNGDLSFMKSKKSSQYKGVSWYKNCNKWRARIKIGGKSKHLGFFADEYQAHLVYQKALENL